MKAYQKFLTIAVLTLSAASSFAGYDEFACITNQNIERAHLQCVACGITKYYADKGIDVNPSHKWLALLGLKVREYKLDNAGRSSVVSSDAERNYKIRVIQKIQEYGFCTEYVGSKTASRSKNMHDMSAEDWTAFYEFLNREDIPGEKSYDKIAKSLGFKSGWMGASGAKKNMDYLFEGFNENLSLDDKRSLFKEKLKQALQPEYNVSGEKNEKSTDFIAAGDKDQGLRSCLTDIKRRFFEQQMSDKETYKMCEVIANACDLARTPMGPNDFCVHKGMGLRPAPAKQRPIPPPAIPSGTGKGVK